MSDQRAGLFHQQQRSEPNMEDLTGVTSLITLFLVTEGLFLSNTHRFSRSHKGRRARGRAQTARRKSGRLTWPKDTRRRRWKLKPFGGRDGGVEGRGNDGKRKIRGDFIRNKTPTAVLLKLEERKLRMTPYRLQPSVSTRSRSTLHISARMLDVSVSLLFSSSSAQPAISRPYVSLLLSKFASFKKGVCP